MRMYFSLIVKGEESLGEKFNYNLHADKEIQNELIALIGQAITLALRLKKSDNVLIEGFKAGMIDEPLPTEDSQPAKHNADVSEQAEVVT